jgi:hypothetical protein
VAQLVEACATSRNVAVSIRIEIFWIFHLLNHSGRSMGLGSTQSLTETSARGISWGGKVRRCVGLTTLPPACADRLEILGAPRTCPDLYRYTFSLNVGGGILTTRGRCKGVRSMGQDISGILLNPKTRHKDSPLTTALNLTVSSVYYKHKEVRTNLVSVRRANRTCTSFRHKL